MCLPNLTLNAIFVFASELVGRLTAALVLILVSRYLGLQATGIYSLGTTFLIVGGRFAAWGLEQILIRDVALERRRASRYVFNFLWLRLLFSGGMSLALTVLIIWVLPYSTEARMPLVILLWGMIPENLTDVCRAVFLAIEESRYVLFINMLLLGFKVGGTIFVLLNTPHPLAVAWAVSLGGVVGSLCALALVWRYTKLTWQEFDLQLSQWAVREGPPFWAINIANILDSQIDMLLLSWFVTEAELGQYAAALGVLLALSILPSTFRLAFFPRIMWVFTHDRPQLAKFYEQSLRYLVTFALPISVGLFLTADQVITIIYQGEFIGSANIVKVLCWILLFLLPGDVNSRLLIASRNQKLSASFTAVGFLVNVITGIALVSHIGILGAAIARLCSAISVAVMNHMFVYRYIVKTNMLKMSWRSVLATSVMAVTVYLLRSTSVYLSIILGGIGYVLCVLLFRVVTPSEILELTGLNRKI